MSDFTRPFYLDVADNKVVGHSFMSKFGQNPAMAIDTPEDIWDLGGDYPYSQNGTAPITKVDSSSGSDTGKVEVQGLDIGGNLVVQEATLTGTTPVTLTTPLWRVFRLKNTGTTDYVGTVQAVNSADNVTYAQIAIGNNQTLMALYTIPKGKRGFLLSGSASMVGKTSAYVIDGHFYMRPYGGVFQLKNTFGLSSVGTSYFLHDYPIPLPISELTDIRVRAESSKADGVMNATFDILLIDKIIRS